MKLYDILTSAIAVFETCLSKALRNGKIDEEEFKVLQTFHLKTMNELTGVDRKIEAENVQKPIRKKPTGRDKRNKENPRNKSLMVCSLCYFSCYFRR